jgi:hypothetical protein
MPTRAMIGGWSGSCRPQSRHIHQDEPRPPRSRRRSGAGGARPASRFRGIVADRASPGRHPDHPRSDGASHSLHRRERRLGARVPLADLPEAGRPVPDASRGRVGRRRPSPGRGVGPLRREPGDHHPGVARPGQPGRRLVGAGGRGTLGRGDGPGVDPGVAGASPRQAPAPGPCRPPRARASDGLRPTAHPRDHPTVPSCPGRGDRGGRSWQDLPWPGSSVTLVFSKPTPRPGQVSVEDHAAT